MSQPFGNNFRASICPKYMTEIYLKGECPIKAPGKWIVEDLFSGRPEALTLFYAV